MNLNLLMLKIIDVEIAFSVYEREAEITYNPEIWDYTGLKQEEDEKNKKECFNKYKVEENLIACPRASLKIDRVPFKNGIIDEGWIKNFFRNNFKFKKNYSLLEGRNFFQNKTILHKNYEKELSKPLQKVG